MAEWKDVQKALTFMRMTEDEKSAVLSIVSGVMLLGNVEVSSIEKQGVPDSGNIDGSAKTLLAEACELLFLNPSLVEEGLLVKISRAGGQEIRGTWKQAEAKMLKDSLAKVKVDRFIYS